MRYSRSRTILICEECGARSVFMDLEDVWRSARGAFECECGRVALSDHAGREEPGAAEARPVRP